SLPCFPYTTLFRAQGLSRQFVESRTRFGAAGMNVNRLACDIGHESGGHLGLAAILHADEQDTGCGRHSASLTAERPWAKPVGIPIFTGSAGPQQPSL